jgi:hypothetical protein
MHRLSRWRYALWLVGTLPPLACLLFAAGAFLWPTDQLVWPASVRGAVYRGETQMGIATLVRRAGRWEGRVVDFPPGTATHFQPNTARGFFVARLRDGRLLALADRSGHRGQRVYPYDPLPWGSRPGIVGFMDRSYGAAYYADGRRLAGPAPRDLDPYPLAIVGERVLIADRAICAAKTWHVETWCR